MWVCASVSVLKYEPKEILFLKTTIEFPWQVKVIYGCLMLALKSKNHRRKLPLRFLQFIVFFSV